MAINTGQPFCNTTDGYLCEGKDIKGGYFVVSAIANAPAAITQTGSLCYCTGDSKFYQYNGSSWVVASFSDMSAYLPKSGGNVSGHIYLTGSNATSSVSNTSQIVFGTASTQHLAISSNDNTLVLNPTTSTTTNQIVLHLDQQSLFPSGINSSGTINAATLTQNGTAVSLEGHTHFSLDTSTNTLTINI